MRRLLVETDVVARSRPTRNSGTGGVRRGIERVGPEPVEGNLDPPADADSPADLEPGERDLPAGGKGRSSGPARTAHGAPVTADGAVAAGTTGSSDGSPPADAPPGSPPSTTAAVPSTKAPADGSRAARAQGAGTSPAVERAPADDGEKDAARNEPTDEDAWPVPSATVRRPGLTSWLRAPVPEHALSRPGPRLRTLVLVALLVVLAFAGSALAYSLFMQEKLYGARVEYVLTPRPDLSDAAVDRLTQTQMLIVTSTAVLQPVASEFDLSVPVLEDAVSVGMQGRSNVLEITVVRPDQQQAVAIADRLSTEYTRVVTPRTTRGQDPPPLQQTLLAAAGPLDEPVQPRPLRSLAGGVLIGSIVAGLLVLALLQPWRSGRIGAYWS
jgi:capsular polysaccharide biosynthesis protein